MAQFAINQYMGNKDKADTPSVNSGGIPAFADRPDPSEIAERSALPELSLIHI